MHAPDSLPLALLMTALAATAGGCAAPEDSPFLESELIETDFRDEEVTDGSETTAKENSPGGGGIWVNNGLADPVVGGVDPAFGLSTPQGLSETEGVLTDPATRVAAEYMVECALPMGTSITKTVDGQPLVFHGQIGLAPEWEDGDCDEDCQQWVTACMLARTNISAEELQIMLLGDHHSLGLIGNPNFPVYESTFFGNIFADPDAQYMCAGSEDQVVLAQLGGRTCSSDPASCGFVEYFDCKNSGRCTVQSVLGEDVSITCMADGDPAPFHAISVYVSQPS